MTQLREAGGGSKWWTNPVLVEKREMHRALQEIAEWPWYRPAIGMKRLARSVLERIADSGGSGS
jgi:hypothetical protein